MLRKQDGPKVCIFGPTLTPYPLKMAEIKNSNHLLRKNVSYRVTKIFQGPISSPYSTKNRITFCTFLEKKQCRVGYIQNLTYPIPGPSIIFLWVWKTFDPTTFQFCGYWHQVPFSKTVNPVFQVWQPFWGRHSLCSKNQFDFFYESLMLNLLAST